MRQGRAGSVRNCSRYARVARQSSRTAPFPAGAAPRSSHRHRAYRPCRRPPRISGSQLCAGRFRPTASGRRWRRRCVLPAPATAGSSATVAGGPAWLSSTRRWFKLRLHPRLEFRSASTCGSRPGRFGHNASKDSGCAAMRRRSARPWRERNRKSRRGSRAAEPQRRLPGARRLDRRLGVLLLLTVRRQRHTLSHRHAAVRTRDAGAKPLDGRGRHLRRVASLSPQPAQRPDALRRYPRLRLIGSNGTGSRAGSGSTATATAGSGVARAGRDDWPCLKVPDDRRRVRPRPPTGRPSGGRQRAPVVPAVMSVLPSAKSLMGMPNPIAAAPAAASRNPSTSNNSDILVRPTQRIRP